MQLPEIPAEVLEVTNGCLSRTRESDAEQLARAIGASLDHTRRWLSWANDEATGVRAQRLRCRDAEECRFHQARVRHGVREGPDQAGLAMSDVFRVEIHTDEANVISAAIPRRLGYRLDRVDECPPEAAAHSGRQQIWVTERAQADPGGSAAPGRPGFR